MKEAETRAQSGFGGGGGSLQGPRVSEGMEEPPGSPPRPDGNSMGSGRARAVWWLRKVPWQGWSGSGEWQVRWGDYGASGRRGAELSWGAC